MTMPWIMHIDMDAFFASVEQLDNPQLRGKPVAVGGIGARSVIAAASYEMRKYGVRSAMPGAQARRLCPQGIFLPARMSRYKEKSKEVMQLLQEFSPVVEQSSIDEAYLDAKGLEGIFGSVTSLGKAIKKAMQQHTGLTCSVGCAPVRFLAKIASDLDKPDGLFILKHEQVQDFLHTLSVEKIPGVGKKALEILDALAVRKATDITRYSEDFWKERLGQRGVVLYARAQGIDPTELSVRQEPKSFSAENTFAHDLQDRALMVPYLLKQADKIASELRTHALRAQNITLKIKYNNFKQVTRSKTMKQPVCDTKSIYLEAEQLLSAISLPLAVRLIGIAVSKLDKKAQQMLLFDQATHKKNEQMEQAVDAIRKRFGSDILQRASVKDFLGKI